MRSIRGAARTSGAPAPESDLPMSPLDPSSVVDRRTFVRALAGYGGAALAAGLLPQAAFAAASRASLLDGIGLQLFTVRDLTANDYPGTLLEVGKIGYREVQTTGSYGDHTPQQIRDYLQRAGVTAPTTHVNPRMGPDFERTLEGHQLIGHRYTTVSLTDGGGRGAAGRAAGAAGQGAGQGQGASGRASGQRQGAAGAQRPAPAPQTLESVKRTAERLNQAGEITRRYGMKVIVHNHTEEFDSLADSSQRPYDVLLAETDPALVAMELDIGWAAVAGQDAVELFRANPGRYEVWHVKDIAGTAELEGLSIQERRRAARIVPLGDGDLDYRPIFAQAELAGMKHYYVEQDTAPQSGDSLAAAARSYAALVALLS
jgi:sugar phosphate isomerase/epimerase